MFFDDTYIGYKARVSYSLLTKDDFSETADFIKTTSLFMKNPELNAYIYNPQHYKYAYLAKVMNKIVGIILFSDLESEVLINHLYVAPAHRFKGIGSNLLKKVREFKPYGSLSYVDASNNYMTWMDVLETSQKCEMINYLGTFYK